MFLNYRSFYFSLFSFLIIVFSSTAFFCSNLTSIDDKDTPCFLETSTQNSIVLHASGNTLVLPCHVARSKHATVEWWYTDLQKSINIKIYPVFPPVRPTVLRFITSVAPLSKNANETDILDASILLRNVNVDDSGIYRCVIRPWAMDPFEQIENLLVNDDSNIGTLNYQVQLTGPRLCQSGPTLLPCFSAMRTSSPTVVDAYQTAFLQCVVNSQNRPVNVFWVVGNASGNSLLITDFLTTNQYGGDRLRRVFPLSLFDYSIELSVNRTIPERIFSCVIDGATELETTLFTYIVRTIEIERVDQKTLNSTKILAHDTLNEEQILSLRESQNVSIDEESTSEEHTHQPERDEETESEEQETSTTI